MDHTRLAIDGGTPVRADPMPARGLMDDAARQAAVELLDRTVKTGQPIGYGGREEHAYEEAFAEFMGGGAADLVNSGTNAVLAAVAALELEPFCEVIVPLVTDCGGAMPVALLGCVPVVADADPRSYNVSPQSIAQAVTARTRAIVVAHIGGDPVDLAPVLDLAGQHGLAIVEDCAQAHGATYQDQLVGTFGSVAAFSTMSGKHHCTGPQGGVVYSRDPDVVMRARRFADRGKPFGMTPPLGNVRAGLNCNGNDLAAAIGGAQLARLPDIVSARQAVGDALRAALRDHPAVRVGWLHPHARSAYWFLRMSLEASALRVDRDGFCRALAAEGIPVVPSYRHIPGEMPWFREKRVLGTPGFPWDNPLYTGPGEPQATIANAIAVTSTSFNIPIHERYGPRETDDILAALLKVTRAYAIVDGEGEPDPS